MSKVKLDRIVADSENSPQRIDRILIVPAHKDDHVPSSRTACNYQVVESCLRTLGFDVSYVAKGSYVLVQRIEQIEEQLAQMTGSGTMGIVSFSFGTTELLSALYRHAQAHKQHGVAALLAVTPIVDIDPPHIQRIGAKDHVFEGYQGPRSPGEFKEIIGVLRGTYGIPVMNVAAQFDHIARLETVLTAFGVDYTKVIPNAHHSLRHPDHRADLVQHIREYFQTFSR